jgi:hypothetical protein
MKHVMFAEKSLLMGDEVADCLLEYARLLAENSAADNVTIRAISPDGNTIDAALLLNASSVMMAESTNSTVEPPSNDEAVKYMQDRIDRLLHPPSVMPESANSNPDYDVVDPDFEQASAWQDGQRARRTQRD